MLWECLLEMILRGEVVRVGGGHLATLKTFLLFQVKVASSVSLDLDACKNREFDRIFYLMSFTNSAFLGHDWSDLAAPSPVFLPGESHGQKSLASYLPWGLKESDMT